MVSWILFGVSVGRFVLVDDAVHNFIWRIGCFCLLYLYTLLALLLLFVVLCCFRRRFVGGLWIVSLVLFGLALRVTCSVYTVLVVLIADGVVVVYWLVVRCCACVDITFGLGCCTLIVVAVNSVGFHFSFFVCLGCS